VVKILFEWLFLGLVIGLILGGHPWSFPERGDLLLEYLLQDHGHVRTFRP
jgi:hypothetical protein